MSEAGKDPFLYDGRIRPVKQHINVVIGFTHRISASAYAFFHLVADVARIGDYTEKLFLASSYNVAEAAARIVRKHK